MEIMMSGSCHIVSVRRMVLSGLNEDHISNSVRRMELSGLNENHISNSERPFNADADVMQNDTLKQNDRQ